MCLNDITVETRVQWAYAAVVSLCICCLPPTLPHPRI